MKVQCEARRLTITGGDQCFNDGTFTKQLAREIVRALTELDSLHTYTATVDRNVLRLAVYEMLHRDDIPPVVSINEAIDMAKKFSTEDSGKFVNGILDKDGKPDWNPSKPEAIGERDVAKFFEPLPPEEEWRPFDF